jgi:hypothetical protein
MTILELSGLFVAIERVCSRLFTAYRGNIVGRHRLFDSPRRPEAADRNRPAAVEGGKGTFRSRQTAAFNGRACLRLSSEFPSAALCVRDASDGDGWVSP